MIWTVRWSTPWLTWLPPPTMGFPEHPTEKFRYFVGNGVRKLCERVLPEDAKEYADRQYALFSEYYNTHYADQTRPYPGIKSLLHRLKDEGILLAVASNKTELFTREIVEHFFGTALYSGFHTFTVFNHFHSSLVTH